MEGNLQRVIMNAINMDKPHLKHFGRRYSLHVQNGHGEETESAMSDQIDGDANDSNSDSGQDYEPRFKKIKGGSEGEEHETTESEEEGDEISGSENFEF